MSETICPGCGGVHTQEDHELQEYINDHARGVSIALMAQMRDDGHGGNAALAVGMAALLMMALDMRAKDMNQDEALRAVAGDLSNLVEQHIAHIHGSHEKLTSARREHEQRRARIEEIEAFLEMDDKAMDLMAQEVRGEA